MAGAFSHRPVTGTFAKHFKISGGFPGGICLPGREYHNLVRQTRRLALRLPVRWGMDASAR